MPGLGWRKAGEKISKGRPKDNFFKKSKGFLIYKIGVHSGIREIKFKKTLT